MKAVLEFTDSQACSGLWIDHDALFALNADNVATFMEAIEMVPRRLDLDGGASVSCSDDGCMDMDTFGATGRLWSTATKLGGAAGPDGSWPPTVCP